jgi:hypothetical protein
MGNLSRTCGVHKTSASLSRSPPPPFPSCFSADPSERQEKQASFKWRRSVVLSSRNLTHLANRSHDASAVCFSALCQPDHSFECATLSQNTVQSTSQGSVAVSDPPLRGSVS